ncbi:MAG: hypothetical protein IJG80_03845 [Selenomonadaceae bacterium]|nr:hypothetical protein [Selenomonadaceae bacterium]MBQ3727534.1 hypothetical protein [Selenomonadaceae bacterium]MBQ9498438.1 hypothetical protein [Selenomonadaceae bacterium]
MGTGYTLHCKECGYNFDAFFGVGFLFPSVYKETMEAAKNGALGEKLQRFLTENPNGAIDVSNVVSVCKKCGEIENVLDLTMYFPKKGFSPVKPQGRWSVAFPFIGEDYVTPWDLQEHYKVFVKYPHKCKRCGAEVELVTEEHLEKINCPNCHKSLSVEDIINWD